MITQMKYNCLNGARTSKIHQDGAAPGLNRLTSATGGQPFMSRGTRGHKSTTTVYNFLKIMQWNAEGLVKKKTELEHLLKRESIDICCIQETHLKKDKSFKMRGYQCIRTDRGGERKKGGVLTLVKSHINAYLIPSDSSTDSAEYQTIKIITETKEIYLVNYYCPNNVTLDLHNIQVKGSNFIIVGDFNSHSQSWGYNHIDARGEEIEEWQDDNNLILINNPDDTPTFYSRCWHTTSTPDIAICTEDIHSITKRTVGDQLGGSDHRPVYLTLDTKTTTAPTVPRWNYKKADWKAYSHRSSILTNGIQTYERDINKVIKEFYTGILHAAKECIPKGARKDYKPYWSDELENKHKALSDARKIAETNPSVENNMALKHASAKYTKTRNEARTNSWIKKTGDLNMETDDTKLWRLTRQLNDEGTRQSKITLLQGETMVYGKQAADMFANTYKEASDITVLPYQQAEVRKEQRNIKEPVDSPDLMDSTISMEELNYAIKKLKRRKSPGPDGITNEMLIYAGKPALYKLLEIFNKTWQEGSLPQSWREATMIPIHKKGKSKTEATSYRPISLTSCVVKLLERIINARLKWFLESEQLLAPQQAGFREHHCTEDQTTYLAQEIEDGFQQSKQTMAIWIDLQKAFNKVWTDGLLLKLKKCRIGGNMYKWIKSYLHNRRARVTIDSAKSKKILLRHGVPQGGVLSPTLFLIFINDLIKQLPDAVKCAMYADDLVMWCTEEHATTAQLRLQEAANILSNWTHDWCVKINKTKSFTTLFTLSTKAKHVKIMLDDVKLQHTDSTTYLGVTFDKRQTWRNHINSTEAKARRKLALLRKLAGTQWGAAETVLKNVYIGAIRPHLEYGSTTFTSASKSTLYMLDKVQNQAMRLITGAMKSTPIKVMEDTTAISSLCHRRDMRNLIQAERYKCSPSHPMKVRINGMTKNRIKRESFIHKYQRLNKVFNNSIKTIQSKFSSLPESFPQVNRSLTIRNTIQGLNKRQDDNIKKQQTLAYIDEHYPHESWIHVYTDGSATNAVQDGGAGSIIFLQGGQTIENSTATGKHCTNYSAEVKALEQGAKAVDDLTDQTSDVVFLTDSRSALDAIQNQNEPNLIRILNGSLGKRRVVLQWIPAHCGINGNEMADKLAKRGAAMTQHDNPITLTEKKTIIKHSFRAKKIPDNYHKLDRAGQVIILRLRTGHNRLNSHMYKTMKLVQSPLCTCRTGDQIADHILQDCPTFTNLRTQIWPDGISLHQQLHGTTEDLRRTVGFIQQTGLSV